MESNAKRGLHSVYNTTSNRFQSYDRNSHLTKIQPSIRLRIERTVETTRRRKLKKSRYVIIASSPRAHSRIWRTRYSVCGCFADGYYTNWIIAILSRRWNRRQITDGWREGSNAIERASPPTRFLYDTSLQITRRRWARWKIENRSKQYLPRCIERTIRSGTWIMQS